MVPGGSSQGSQKPANGQYIEPDDPDRTIQLKFLTQTPVSHLRKRFFLLVV
jgi:hypothetical protein